MALIQRQGRPALDLEPDATPNTGKWAERYDTDNECNKAVPERKKPEPPNGWTKEMYDINHEKDV